MDTVDIRIGGDDVIVDGPRLDVEEVAHERRILALDQGTVAADDVLFAGIQVVWLTHH